MYWKDALDVLRGRMVAVGHLRLVQLTETSEHMQRVLRDAAAKKRKKKTPVRKKRRS